jgi:L-rhamnose mutarotase
MKEQSEQKPLIRKAFVMGIFEGVEEEYERRHNPIWPELHETLKAHGVHNYSIYFDRETHALFGYAEIESEERWAAIASTDVYKRWAAYMSELMPTNSSGTPVSREIREVFHID